MRRWFYYEFVLHPLDYRHVYENRDEVARKGAKARDHVLQKYSLDAIGPQLVRNFHRVLAKLNITASMTPPPSNSSRYNNNPGEYQSASTGAGAEEL